MSMPHICTINHQTSDDFLPYHKDDLNVFHRLYRGFKSLIMLYKHHPECSDYYRSSTAYMQERKLHFEDKYYYMIHPLSRFCFFYESILMLTYVVAFVYFPLKITFLQNNTFFKIEMYYIMCLLHFIFSVEILLRIFTGIRKKGSEEIVMNQKKVLKAYILSLYFPADLLAAFPNEMIFICFGETDLFTYYLQIIRCLKLIRLVTFLKYFLNICKKLGCRTLLSKLCCYCISALLFLHWEACFLYVLPLIRKKLTGSYANHSIYWVLERNSNSTHEKYVQLLFATAGLLFCARRAVKPSYAIEEKIYVFFLYITGKIIMLALAVIFVNTIQGLHQLETKYQEVMSQVGEFMKDKKLPLATRERLVTFYEYRFQKKYVRQDNIHSILSEGLKKEINYYTCQNLVKQVEIFRDLPIKTLNDIFNNLQQEFFLPNDIIIKAGAQGDCMYFLSSGTVSLTSSSGKEICHLQDGSYFGEVSLITDDRIRRCNVVALEICDTFRLDKKRFKKCIQENSLILQRVQAMAVKRAELVEQIEQAFQQELFIKTFLAENKNLKTVKGMLDN